MQYGAAARIPAFYPYPRRSAAQKQSRAARESLPTLYILAGPTGSGKSTLAEQLRGEFKIPPGIWVNADEIAARMRGESPGNTNPSLAAAMEADRLRHAALDAGHDLITETVMSDAIRWVPFFQKATALGYRISLYFVTTSDASINVARVRTRVAMQGHDVPEDRIRSRYTKVMRHVLPLVMPLTHQTFVFDNSSVENGMRLIAVYRNGRLVQFDEARNSALGGWLAGLMR